MRAWLGFALEPYRVRRFLSARPVASSTAFALQVLEEKGERASATATRLSVLLFQDLAAIPLIALVPLFASSGAGRPAMDLSTAVLAIGTILGVIIVGRFLLNRFLPHRRGHRRA
jgi:Kef-type K+ transport system membrane component KefB